MRSPCAENRESGRRRKYPPPGTVTMTNCPGAARRATRGAMSSIAAKAPKWRTPATRQWDGLRPLRVVAVRVCRSRSSPVRRRVQVLQTVYLHAAAA